MFLLIAIMESNMNDFLERFLKNSKYKSFIDNLTLDYIELFNSKKNGVLDKKSLNNFRDKHNFKENLPNTLKLQNEMILDFSLSPSAIELQFSFLSPKSTNKKPRVSFDLTIKKLYYHNQVRTTSVLIFNYLDKIINDGLIEKYDSWEINYDLDRNVVKAYTNQKNILDINYQEIEEIMNMMFNNKLSDIEVYDFYLLNYDKDINDNYILKTFVPFFSNMVQSIT